MTARSSPRRGVNRFEVRVHTATAEGIALNTVKTRTAKLTVGILAVMELARLWAASDGAVRPGTHVALIDTTDGGEIMSLRWHGFEPNTLDGVLNTLRTNGFPNIQEVASGKD